MQPESEKALSQSIDVATEKLVTIKIYKQDTYLGSSDDLLPSGQMLGS